MNNSCSYLYQKCACDVRHQKNVTQWSFSDKKIGLFGEVHGFILIGEDFGWVHQLVGSTAVDMYKMSVIVHFFLFCFVQDLWVNVGLGACGRVG